MFLDTSGLLCVIDDREPFHRTACESYDAGRKRVTHNVVLAELLALAQVRGVERGRAVESIVELMADPEIEIVWIDEDDFRQALSLLQARRDKTYSLCDALSFVLMRQRGLTDALTTDRHFEQEGFQRLLV
jgi:predicted nucleic acid-binding protein